MGDFTEQTPTTIIGAGLTGLTAATVLNRSGAPVRVLESEPAIGGASMTARFGDHRFDLGGHRFYTRNEAVLALVRELIGDELLSVPRQSRIFLRGSLVDYPLTFFNALSALGPVTSAHVAASYAWEKVKQLFRTPPQETFADWVISRFGRRLYDIYFRPYSEKVWGVPCTELKADFAEQRIKGLSFREAVRDMFFKRDGGPATLVSRFLYPRLGFGRIPEAMAETLPPGSIRLRSPVLRVEHAEGRVNRVVCWTDRGEEPIEVSQVISTIPITDLIDAMCPSPPAEVAESAHALQYRDMVIVFLTLDREQVTPDQWIYFSSGDVFFGRMHEPKNWSPEMAPPGKTGLVVEIFCYKDEPVWHEPDNSIAQRVATRLEELGLIRATEHTGSKVIRLPRAYPLYAGDYRRHLQVVMDYLSRFDNLQTCGRNGLFRYTSGDYYIEMGMKAAENVLGRDHDLTSVAAEQVYAEK